jgi:hypothetical protein
MICLINVSLGKSSTLIKDKVVCENNVTCITESCSMSGIDCSVRIEIKLENGTTIQGVIVFEDVSWWDCKKMQLVAWLERNF